MKTELVLKNNLSAIPLMEEFVSRAGAAAGVSPERIDMLVLAVEEAGLYNVEGGHIIEIIRFDHEIISPVSKDEFIFGGDRLIFSGDVARILELKKTHQLVNATHHVFALNEVEGNRRHSLSGGLSDGTGDGCQSAYILHRTAHISEPVLCLAHRISDHMLVYGPGGYRFSDFMRVGIIMNVIMLIATLVFTPMIFPF